MFDISHNSGTTAGKKNHYTLTGEGEHCKILQD